MQKSVILIHLLGLCLFVIGLFWNLGTCPRVTKSRPGLMYLIIGMKSYMLVIMLINKYFKYMMLRLWIMK